MLHRNPVMTRQDIRNAFTALPAFDPSNPLSSALGTSGLADQIEMIKIVPSTMSREEMAWLWTALKADYRPTYPFTVSVVLMQAAANVSLAFPVLYRQIGAQNNTPAQLITAQATVPPALLGIGLPTVQVSSPPGPT